jgi:predicted ATPase
MGNLPLARSYLARGIERHERQRPHRQTLQDGLDDGVAGLGYAAWVLWALGYPDQARQKTDAMLMLAQRLSHPLNLAWALNSAAWHWQFQRNPHAAQQYAEAEIALCEEHRFAQLHAVGLIVQGWTLASQERAREGIRLMETGIASAHQTGAAIGRPRYLTVLAEAYAAVGHYDKAVSSLSEAEHHMAATGEYFYAVELYRLQGVLFLHTESKTRRTDTLYHLPPTAYQSAEECLQKAIETARQQRAKSLELRAVISLCHLWKAQERWDSARQALRKIYPWFREGLTTPDLQAARALLEELDDHPPQAGHMRKAPAVSRSRQPALSKAAV